MHIQPDVYKFFPIIILPFLLSLAAGLYVVPAQAELIVSCPTGMKYQGNTCYQPCKADYIEDGPLCRKACNAGFNWNGLACSKLAGLVNYYPESYIRRSAFPKTCNATSFSRELPAIQNSEPFTLLISSDGQYPWSPSARSQEELLEKGEQTNRQQIQAMNTITSMQTWPDTTTVPEELRGQRIAQPKGVIFNGDLTAFWHDWQAEKYMDMYHRNDDDPNNLKNLKLDVYPGLGNHDYANNAGDCWWKRNIEYLPLGPNGCAKNAADYIKKTLSCNLVSNFPSSSILAFDENSLAYAWAIGGYYFIQLQNYPTYTYDEIGISSSIQWLQGELSRANSAGYRIVLLMHDYGDHMPKDDPEFLSAIAGKNIVALFSGHIHNSYGYTGHVPGYPDIPTFRSGSAQYNTFLLTEFGRESMTVAVISSQNGTPRFLTPDQSQRMTTIRFSSP